MRIADLAATVTSPLDGRDRGVEAAAPVSDERERWSQIEAHVHEMLRAHAERHGEGPADELAREGWLAAWDGAIAEAEELLLAALAVDPAHGPARYALGQVRWWQDRHDEAVACLAPVAADRWAGWWAHWMLGAVHQDMGDDAAAERHLRRALAAEPDKDNPAAAMSLSTIALRRGDLRRGWGLHEARKRHPMWAPTIRSRVAPRLPRWTGRASLRGKVLALPAENGLGDKMLHARFLGPRARGPRGARCSSKRPRRWCRCWRRASPETRRSSSTAASPSARPTRGSNPRACRMCSARPSRTSRPAPTSAPLRPTWSTGAPASRSIAVD